MSKDKEYIWMGASGVSCPEREHATNKMIHHKKFARKSGSGINFISTFLEGYASRIRSFSCLMFYVCFVLQVCLLRLLSTRYGIFHAF